MLKQTAFRYPSRSSLKHYWSENEEIRKCQEKTFNKLKNRKDILPYPLDTFLQAFKESNDEMDKLIIARYITSSWEIHNFICKFFSSLHSD